MTEEELRQTKEFKEGQQILMQTWSEDKNDLRPENNSQIKSVEVYSQTLATLQGYWKIYKENIPKMNTKEFWKYPEGVVATGSDDQQTILWMFNTEDNLIQDSPSYGTLTKCLMRFWKLYEKLWQEKYCEIVTGHKWESILSA